MANVSYRLDDLKKAIVGIGYVGENDHMHVLIDCKEVFDEYPNAVPTMAIVPPVGEGYPKAVTRNGDVVEWLVKDSDVTAEGDGEFQITFTEGEVIKKSVNGRFRVIRSISGSGEAPSGIDDWLSEANEKLAEVEEAEIHQPIIGLDGYWYTWNQETGEYEKTNTKAQGADGHSPVLTSSKSGKTTTLYADGEQIAQILDGEDGQGADVIDDTSGEGDTDKTWSADKLTDEFGDVLNAIHGFAPAVLGTAVGAVATFDGGVEGAEVKKLASSFSYTQEYGVPTPSNPIPIYGRTKDTIYHSGSDTSQATAIDVAWGNELGTVYRAKTFDAIQGSMLVDMVGVDLGSLTWTKQTGSAKDYFYTPLSNLEYFPKYVSDSFPDAVCSVFSLIYQSASSWGVNSFLFTAGAGTLPAQVLAVNVTKDAYADADAFKTAMSGQFVVYEVTEPFTLTFTPVAVNTKNGINKFWNENNKQVEVKYITDTTSFIQKEVDEVTENTQSIKQIINLYTTDGIASGTINYDGSIYANADYVTTDFIEIQKKNNKNLNYVHAFDGSGYAHSIGFYNSSKAFISRITSVSNAVQIPSGAKYARVAFAAENTDRAVIFTNENTKPQYEPQKKYLQYENDLNSFNKFVNSDGAVSAMIATGLMYLGDEQFGYGTEHTLFATSCVKSTKDTHSESSNYTGERYQLDCSAYTQIMLMGITPECSRYFSNKNIPSPNGYRFNRYVQYEGYVYNVLQEGNTKRLYANSIAEYAYKNGYLFLIDDGFTNIRPGDILFWSNQPSSYHFFEDIGHAGVVVDVVPMEDGSNTVVTFEGKGGSGSPCQFQSYTSRASAMIYAARFPMPYVHDDAEDIASFSSAVTTAVSGSSGSVVDIATVQTTKTLEAGKMYTVLLKCELPDDCYVQLKTNGMSHIGIANDDVLKRPDGYYVFRIFSKKSDTLTETGSITVQAHCTGSVSDNAVLSKTRIYEGFVTPVFD